MGMKFQPRVGPFVYRSRSGLGPISGTLYLTMKFTIWAIWTLLVVGWALLYWSVVGVWLGVQWVARRRALARAQARPEHHMDHRQAPWADPDHDVVGDIREYQQQAYYEQPPYGRV